MKGYLKQLREGIWEQNPIMVLLLGMCATLATSTSVVNGLGMGISTTLVLICSNIVISLLRKVIPNQTRIASYVVIIAGFVSAVDMLLQAYLPDISESLGIFIPLIVVNCIILARAEAYASHSSVFKSAIDGLGMGLGFTFTLLLMSIIREILGNGTLFSGLPFRARPHIWRQTKACNAYDYAGGRVPHPWLHHCRKAKNYYDSEQQKT